MGEKPYVKIVIIEWHFDFDGWSFVMEQIGSALVVRLAVVHTWYLEIEVTNGHCSVTQHVENSHGNNKTMPASLPDAVEAYITEHGVPS